MTEIDSRRISGQGWGGDGEKKLSPCSSLSWTRLRLKYPAAPLPSSTLSWYDAARLLHKSN